MEEEAALVKRIDDDMLYYDLKELLNEVMEGEAPEVKITLSYRVIPFEAVETFYLELYHKLIAKNCTKE